MAEGRIQDHPLLGPLPEIGRVSFTFDGEPVVARAGEPIAVALLAHGIRRFRTMPFSGTPRGGFCFSGRCSDCLVMVDGAPNVMACTTTVREGMIVETQQGVGRWHDDDGATA